MRILVWQWGRRGAGPRFAASLAEGLQLIPGVDVALSLSTGAEIMRSGTPPTCEMPVATYSGRLGYLWRMVRAPFSRPHLSRLIAALRPDVAICAMPGPLDWLMTAALRKARVPFAVVVHDANAHPGEDMRLRIYLQQQMVRQCDLVVTLSEHVAVAMRRHGAGRVGKPLVLSHPPFMFAARPPPPLIHAGPVRLLCFGRLLRYKGLDLLADAIRGLEASRPWTLRVVGKGPESAEIEALRALPGVSVENRWVPEDEIGDLIGWSDVVVLPYREASQSGIAPAALAAGRFVVATRVGGLVEQLRGEPMATLCDATGPALAQALRRLVEAPLCEPHPTHARDPRLAWREMAEELLNGVRTIARGADQPWRHPTGLPDMVSVGDARHGANEGEQQKEVVPVSTAYSMRT